MNDKEGKMSKSRGDFLTISLLVTKGYNPLAYRYLILNSYYHNTLTFTYDILDGAQNEYNKLKSRIASIKEEGEYIEKDFNRYVEMFKEALENDLNTSMCLTILYELIKDKEVNGNTKIKIIEDIDKVLSLDLLKNEDNNIDKELEIYINEMISKRNDAKKNKDYDMADKIRNELLDKGIVLKDTWNSKIRN